MNPARGRHWIVFMVVLVAAVLAVARPDLRAAAGWLYQQSAALGAWLSEPVDALRLHTGTSLLTPFLLGLMGAAAPCQLSSGAAALAYVVKDGRAGTGSRSGGRRPTCWRACWST